MNWNIREKNNENDSKNAGIEKNISEAEKKNADVEKKNADVEKKIAGVEKKVAGMGRNIRGIVWFLLTLAGCIFTMTILGTVQGAPRLGWAVTVFMTLVQLAGLVYYLHAKPGTLPPVPVKVLVFLMHLSFLGVFGVFGFSVFSLANEYHNPVEVTESSERNKDGNSSGMAEDAGTAGTNMVVKETDDLYIMCPGGTSVEFVVGARPKRSDKTVTFCAAAEFQKTYSFSFDPAELPGTYVSCGTEHTGYELDGLGAFAYYDGTFHFANEDEAAAEIENALAAGGSAFQQFLVIDDGEIVMTPSSEYRCFRVLAELDGELCVIDSKVPTHYEDFAEELLDLGVEHAMYMDMGSGWNYSWYRNNAGKARTLIGMYWPFSHNWLVFRFSE